MTFQEKKIKNKKNIIILILCGLLASETALLTTTFINKKFDITKKTEIIENNSKNKIIKKYTVKKNDTLSEIVYSQYGKYSLKAIKAIVLLNEIKDVNKIYINQKLYIPTEEHIKALEKDNKLNFSVNNWVIKEAIKSNEKPEIINEYIIEKISEPEIIDEPVVEEISEPEIIDEPVVEEISEPEIIDEPIVEEISEPEIIDEPVVEEISEPEIIDEPVIEEISEPEIINEPIVEEISEPEIIDEPIVEENTISMEELNKLKSPFQIRFFDTKEETQIGSLPLVYFNLFTQQNSNTK